MDSGNNIGPSVRVINQWLYDLSKKEIVLFGGSDDYFVTGLVFGDTWIMKNHVWGKVSDMGPPPSAIGSMVYTGTRVVLFGGVDILSRFNPSGDTWDKKLG